MDARRLDTGLSVTLTVAAVLMAVAVVRREFIPRSSSKTSQFADGPATFVERWKDLLPSGLTAGDPEAPVRIVVFSDMECPFCRQFHATLRRARQRFGPRVSYTFVHYPVSTHRFARPAARAVECAAAAGRFEQFQDVVFDKQDSLGLKTWESYAREAGLDDVAEFQRCVRDTIGIPRIDAGLVVGQKIGVRGTPTVLINGWRLPGTPPDTEVTRVIASFLAGTRPFK